MINKTKIVEDYFIKIDQAIKNEYEVAKQAKSKGLDPDKKVEIMLVKDMAQRVEGLIGIISPQIIGSGVSNRIKELEKEFSPLDWRISLVISHEVAEQKFCKFKDKLEAIDIGIRVGFAYHTMGVVASPLEGFCGIKIRKRKDGKEYFAIQYSGPIRSAGGTGASVSVLIADYVRKKMGYAPYDPEEKEVKRYITELYDYHERITNLQYLPSEQEIEFMTKNLPIQVDGDPSEKIEVSNYKDLERVDTNFIRNGICLVIGEGLTQKAKKLWKQLSKWGNENDLDQWSFIGEFVELQKSVKAKGTEKTKKGLSPDYTFIKDIVAGRPVYSYPLRSGGFRLRYGRARTSGYSASAIHPATMIVSNRFLAYGTQLKVERPGKAASITSCDTIMGPVVKLEDETVVQVDDVKTAKEIKDQIIEILYLGDMLFNYGDFFNRAHPLATPGYCEEWWIQDLEKHVVELFGTIDIDKLSDLTQIDSEKLNLLFEDPFHNKLNAKEAIQVMKKLDMPLHPYYTYFWREVNIEMFKELLEWMKKANYMEDKIVLPYEKAKRGLELAGIPHKSVLNEHVVIQKDQYDIIKFMFKDKYFEIKEETNALEVLKKYYKIKDKSGVFIGARMGRPEKAKMRKLSPPPHVLFPVGEEGGKTRTFQNAMIAKKIISEFSTYYCEKCQKENIFSKCECGNETKLKKYCRECDKLYEDECPKHGEIHPYRLKEININKIFQDTLNYLELKEFPDLIKGVKGTSNKEHTTEHIAKGILRAKYEVSVNKDGTIRYDMTQVPLTHFKPKEIQTSVEKLKELGYLYDIKGKPLENEDQILELFPQDIVLPASDESPDLGSDEILYKATKFIDELLEKFYKIKPFYNLESKKDLAGQIVMCLAPHTSAAIISRIIGFSKIQGFLAHPLIHAATRRDCDGDEACVTLLMDGLLNFSKKYLPAHKGSTQDAPLVLTSRLIPAEVDDMVFDMDVAWKYPLEFYEADFKNPWEIKIDQISARLGKPEQYHSMGFTHDTSDFNNGVRCSAYKTLPSMKEKLYGQMDLAEKIRAVNTSDVGKLVLEKHFLKDIKGNLRKFSMQQFRCVSCNKKYRRPPLMGKCTCGGKIIFTISEGSVIKYLEPTISIAEKYNLSPYLKQTIEILRRTVDSVFGKEKEKQEGLGKWFG